MVEVIAEAGSNHNGCVADALQLVEVAHRAGASSVKFQFIFPEGLYVPKYFVLAESDEPLRFVEV